MPRQPGRGHGPSTLRRPLPTCRECMETLSSQPRTPEGNTVGRRPDNPGPSCEASAETEYVPCTMRHVCTMRHELWAMYCAIRTMDCLFFCIKVIVSEVGSMLSENSEIVFRVRCCSAPRCSARVDLASG